MPDTIVVTPSPSVAVTVAATTSSLTQVVSPIVNTGTSLAPIIGINQSLLTIAQSQVSGLVTLLAAKAPLADPSFTGVPLAPTATAGTNTTQIATTAFVGTAVSNLVNAAPATLNTLNELATALGNDASFATTVTTSLSGKANLASANAFTVGGHSITAEGTAIVPLFIRGAASQTADLFQTQNSASQVGLAVERGGALSVTPSAAVNGYSMFVRSPTASVVTTMIRGAASQSANLQEWQNSGGTALASIGSGGLIKTTAQIQTPTINSPTDGLTNMTIGTSRNIQLFSATGAYGGGAQVLGIANASTVPTSNPTGGGVLYVDTGALKYRGTSGSAGTLVNADGTITAIDATVATAATGVGYMGLPQNTTTTGAYTIVAADAGQHIYASATRTVTIPANSALALPIGTTLTFIAGAGATMTIAITTDTMYLAGAGTTGSRTLAAHGIATAVKTTATTWLISGNGLT